jgi:hypothetical protein
MVGSQAKADCTSRDYSEGGSELGEQSAYLLELKCAALPQSSVCHFLQSSAQLLDLLGSCSMPRPAWRSFFWLTVPLDSRQWTGRQSVDRLLPFKGSDLFSAKLYKQVNYVLIERRWM